MAVKVKGKGRRPLVFGEVLFDVLPDHREVIGGAPFNVAMHLAALGENPYLVTRIGNDRRGQTLLDRMERWKLDISGVQVDREHPTGIVNVSLDKGDPSYSIDPGAAWDFIEEPREEDCPDRKQVALLYHGTLALRYKQSRESFQKVQRKLSVPLFLDLNLRLPWYSMATVETVIGNAAWLKLNRRELREVTSGAVHSVARDVVDLRRKYNVQDVLVTDGPKGALHYDKSGKETKARGVRVRDLEDTVGAGDAFSAVTILGHLRGWPLAKTLERATQFAARVCTIRGALPAGRNWYEETVKEWNASDEQKKPRR